MRPLDQSENFAGRAQLAFLYPNESDRQQRLQQNLLIAFYKYRSG